MSQKLQQYGTLTDVGVGAPNRPSGSTVSVIEAGNDIIHRTKIIFSNVPLTVGNTTGVSFGGVKLYDFPLGRIAVLGSILKSVSLGLGSSLNATPIDSADGGDISMGSTAPTDGTLTGTDVDLIPSTSIDPLSDGITRAVLAAAAQIGDGVTAVDAYFNLLIDDVDVADAASDVVLANGIWIFTWSNLDYVPE